MSLQVYPPIIIVDIIINEFFPYRNITLTSKGYTDDEIIQDMEKYEYIRIDGKSEPRGKRDKVLFIIIKSNDTYVSFDLKKIKKILEILEKDNIKDTLNEFYLITNKEYFDKKNFNDIIKDLHNKQKGGYDPDGECPYYSVCPYHNFCFSVPKCKVIFPHIVMSKDEVNDFLAKERINIKDLPIILTSDVNIIWNGGKPGQVVCIHRKSETTLESVYYRRIESHVH
jgi:DNA-directed RNA polymerase subunit H (RpoH/RPB5)